MHNLRRRLARLQLYRWHNLSGPDVIVASSLNDGQTLTDGPKRLLQEPCTLEHLRTPLELVPFISRCTVNHFITFSKNHADTLQTRTHTIHRNTDVLSSQRDAFKIKVLIISLWRDLDKNYPVISGKQMKLTCYHGKTEEIKCMNAWPFSLELPYNFNINDL